MFGGADAVKSWDEVLGDQKTGWFAQTSDFFAGMADTISFGLTAEIRGGMGYDDVVDKESDAFRYGGYAGQAVNIGLMCVTPAGWAKLAVNGLSWASTIGGGIQAGRAALNGDYEQAGQLLLQTGLKRLAGKGSPCNASTQIGKYGQKAMWAYGTAEQSQAAVGKIMNGDIVGGLLDLAQAGASARRMM